MFDLIVGLLATAGEATLLTAMMRVGLLEKPGTPPDIPVPSIRSDPNHVAVVELGDMPEHLIFDEDFGWLWYNAVDGPADEQE